ncbi:MAG: TIGR03862 family flavoprotein [Pseudorhodoplanes sp.]|jgi:uncharacterized flavoprotein (TIGR03862 family)|nr:TIGR03862 family flavoprotein [Pseudorhodoplanes sp.]
MAQKTDKTAAVIGGGPAGLMAAEVLADAGVAVTVHDRMPSLGRKFLMAGRGGLNLTHSEAMPRFLSRYGAAAEHLRAAIDAFPPNDLRAWSEQLGQNTFVGSSGRVFPQSMKASPLLRAWLRRLDAKGVRVALRHRWKGWDAQGRLVFADAGGNEQSVATDVVVLALGGASWPKLGSDGGWAEILRREGIAVAKLRPANCGFLVQWSDIFRDRFEGQPLKRIALSFGGETVRGEAMISRAGLEGGGVYALSSRLRDAVERDGEAILTVDLLPNVSIPELAKKLGAPRGKTSLSNFLRKAVNLSPAAIGLAQELAKGKLADLAPDAMARLLKAVPVTLIGVAPITRAISTAGGVSFGDVDANFMLHKKPGVFVAGEMLDWEAPTGGYLLQACFATGRAAGKGAAAWVSLKPSS